MSFFCYCVTVFCYFHFSLYCPQQQLLADIFFENLGKIISNKKREQNITILPYCTYCTVYSVHIYGNVVIFIVLKLLVVQKSNSNRNYPISEREREREKALCSVEEKVWDQLLHLQLWCLLWRRWHVCFRCRQPQLLAPATMCVVGVTSRSCYVRSKCR